MMNNVIRITDTCLRPATIKVGGFKHLTVGVLNAILSQSNQKFVLENVPDIADTQVLKSIFESMGAKIHYSHNIMHLDTFNVSNQPIPIEASKQVHGSLYMIPVLLARFGYVDIGECGGCAIGDSTSLGRRPVDHMLKVLETFGASFTYQENRLIGECTELRSCTIDIQEYSISESEINGPYVSGATKTAILASLGVKKGKTIIKNIYPKLDVLGLIDFIKQLPYDITLDNGTVTIEYNSNKAVAQEVRYTISADISEIMTWYAFAYYHQVPITLTHINPTAITSLKAEFLLIEQMGLQHEYHEAVQELHICPIDKPRIKSVDIVVKSTDIYSDHQPFFCLLLTKGDRVSTIRDLVWKNRFQYVDGLLKMGMSIKKDDAHIMIEPHHKQGQQTSHLKLLAKDLRAAASLVIAGANCPGIEIEGYHHMIRGYEQFSHKISMLGVGHEII